MGPALRRARGPRGVGGRWTIKSTLRAGGVKRWSEIWGPGQRCHPCEGKEDVMAIILRGCRWQVFDLIESRGAVPSPGWGRGHSGGSGGPRPKGGGADGWACSHEKDVETRPGRGALGSAILGRSPGGGSGAGFAAAVPFRAIGNDRGRCAWFVQCGAPFRGSVKTEGDSGRGAKVSSNDSQPAAP